ncbi:hypothetical protein Syun_011507 [Stephania yunnanensis]|uniref:Uncharacterized protein n=1 Tax=Stephania yunnanensis TaxID=152371 RepID=A0AAP0JXN3_9MAGN
MRTLHFNTHTLCSSPPSLSSNYTFSRSLLRPLRHHNPTFSRTLKIRAISTIPESESAEAVSTEVEPPAIDLAFVHSVLLPDGTPDVQIRTACGGQKLRDIMLNSNLELYGPYL